MREMFRGLVWFVMITKEIIEVVVEKCGIIQITNNKINM